VEEHEPKLSREQADWRLNAVTGLMVIIAFGVAVFWSTSTLGCADLPHPV